MKSMPLLAAVSLAIGLSVSPLSADAQASKFSKVENRMVPIPGRNYELSQYEVTQAEWDAVMGSNPSEKKGQVFLSQMLAGRIFRHSSVN